MCPSSSSISIEIPAIGNNQGFDEIDFYCCLHWEYKFSKKHTNNSLKVKIEDYTIRSIPQATLFMYLGSIIKHAREIEGDVNYRFPFG